MDNCVEVIPYVTFILGRDFLHDMLKYDDGTDFEDDVAYDYCHKIARKFIDSDEFKQNKGTCDCLVDYLHNTDIVNGR